MLCCCPIARVRTSISEFSCLNSLALAKKLEDFRFTVTKVSSEIQILEMIPQRDFGQRGIVYLYDKTQWDN